MKKVKVHLGKRSYDVEIGSGAAAKLPGLIKKMGFTGPVVVITDKTVNTKTSHITRPILNKLKNDVVKIVVPATEQSKSLRVFRDTIQKISKKTKTHKPLIVALGGGVVGDLAGFVAATYRRGVPLIQLPTTLLAQVDSSVGGKAGVDLPEAKNLVGAFYQPKAVLVDTDLLKTLPARQIKNGMAEVIKYAVIKDSSFFKFLEENIAGAILLKKDTMEKIIRKCVSIKAGIVEKDELDDKDIRVILNYGHTLGHAVEAASGYSKLYNHGESIAVGMILAGEIAFRLEMLSSKDLERMKKLIKKTVLPVRIKGVSLKKIINSCGYDKKFIAGSNRFVLPKRMGSVEVVEGIPDILVHTVLRQYLG
ncbi:MAG: 3-dehydroquinate synthase [Candidatus Omnitrophica bacterium]|nr:3-dehydroquinate synthase [Candidatus Omnitrophota bacterium]